MITLFVDGYYVNQFDATCLIALEEKGLPYTTVRALLRDGGGLPAALYSKTGISRVPAIQHGDFYLTESAAIVEYLEEAFPPPRFAPLLPTQPRERARARQAMSYVRTEVPALREERSWWMCVYPLDTALVPLSPAAEAQARELVHYVEYLVELGETSAWCLAHADLALTLYRLARTGYALSGPAQRLLDANLVRPSVRAYLEHPRPPNPPPWSRAFG